MTRLMQAATLALVLILSTTSLSEGQEAAPQAGVESLKVQIVFARYQGEKKISNVPYELSVRTDGSKAQLRMGTQVPVPSTAVRTPDGKRPDSANGALSYTYKDVGTNIDCTASSLGDGRFKIDITLEDSSVSVDKGDTPNALVAGVPSFRSFRTTNSLVLRNGQSTQFTVATDKISGETTKVDISLIVSK